MNTPNREQAVVVGAGIAGIATARVLAEFYSKVIVLEQDGTRPLGAPRPGVPQGRHPHVLMCGGFMALARLFPGLELDLMAAGSLPYAAGRDLRTEIPGVGVLPRRDFELSSFVCTRPGWRRC